jgi:hypothetical protein
LLPLGEEPVMSISGTKVQQSQNSINPYYSTSPA